MQTLTRTLRQVTVMRSSSFMHQLAAKESSQTYSDQTTRFPKDQYSKHFRQMYL